MLDGEARLARIARHASETIHLNLIMIMQVGQNLEEAYRFLDTRIFPGNFPERFTALIGTKRVAETEFAPLRLPAAHFVDV